MGSFIASLIAVTASLFLLVLAFVLSSVALWSCAICDNGPPNYIVALTVTGTYLVLQFLIWKIWRAACTSKGYKS